MRTRSRDEWAELAVGREFDPTPAAEPRPLSLTGGETVSVLAELGLDESDVAKLRAAGTVA